MAIDSASHSVVAGALASYGEFEFYAKHTDPLDVSGDCVGPAAYDFVSGLENSDPVVALDSGNDASTNKDHPVTVVDGDGSSTALSGIVQISAGEEHTCAMTSGGEGKCWGNGNSGRLGNDASTERDHPVTVVDGDGSSDALDLDGP